MVFAFAGCKNSDKTDDIKAPSSSEKTTEENGEISSTPVISAAENIVLNMTLEEKIAQLFIVTPEQLVGGKTVTSFSGGSLKYAVSGVALFAANIVTPEQCRSLISSLQDASKIPLFIAVDEEGGKVARVANNPAMHHTVFPNTDKITTPEAAKNAGQTIGKELKALGFNLDFAPVADVNSNPNNTIIGVRSFGTEPRFVSTQVAAAVMGFKTSEMLCTLKHFPGHGDTSVDSHKALPIINKSLEQLRNTEFVPFKAGINAGAEFVMLGHIAVPSITGNRPASLSKEMVNILRDDLDFNGIIITDSMKMRAITNEYSASTAAVLALKAGNDIILIPNNLDEAVSAVFDAVENGEITESRIDSSVLKILNLKLKNGIIKE